MAVLVAYASKHGATQGIAKHIAQTLRQRGKDVEVLPIDAVADVSAYDAVVIGSAVYYGSWLKEATEFIRRNRAELAGRPVWLFSSGPLGVEVKEPQEQPKEIAEFRETILPQDHRVFFGALDHHTLSFPERMVVKAVRAPEGDYRDWPAIAAWAESIAKALPTTASVPHPV